VLSHTSQYSAPTEKQYAAIGCAVVEWANVELLLGTMLTRLLSTPEFLGRIYTSSMSAVRLQEAISEAAEIHAHRYGHRLIASGLVQEIREVNGRVTTLRALRNKLAHFCWMRLSDDELFGTSLPGGMHSEKKERREYATLTLRELEQITSDSHALVETLMAIVKRLPEVTEESLLSPSSSGESTALAHSGH
jgi:hypothetical protein